MGRYRRSYPPGRTVGPTIGPGPVPPGPTKYIPPFILPINSQGPITVKAEGFEGETFGIDTFAEVKVQSDTFDYDFNLGWESDDEWLITDVQDLPESFGGRLTLVFDKATNQYQIATDGYSDKEYTITILSLTNNDVKYYP